MDRLKQIFQRQTEIHDKFIPIENASGLGLHAIAGDTEPHDLSDQRFQFVVKGYAWRVIEEIAEVIEAHGHDHLHEECADCLHFFVELCLILNISPECLTGYTNIDGTNKDLLDIMWIKAPEPNETDIQILVYQFVKHFGIAMECLKNKPWKQTMVEVDRVKFIDEFRYAGFILFGIFKWEGLTRDTLMEVYLKKADTNDERIERGR